MEMTEQTSELFKALNTFRKTLKQPVKDTVNPFFKSTYVTLDGVIKAVDDALEGTGLSFMQEATTSEKTVSVKTYIFHDSGQMMALDPLTLPAVKTDPQGLGSAITYAKRYALAAAFGVTSDVDDDGNQAVKSQKSNKPKQNEPKQSEPTAPQADKLSDNQRKAIFAKANVIAKANNMTADEVITAYKIEDVAEISKKKASNLIDRLDKKVNALKNKPEQEKAGNVPLFDVNRPPFEDDDIKQYDLPF